MDNIDSYLTNLAKKLKLEDGEKAKIEVSISNLKQKLWALFQNKLVDIKIFGSYDRETVLPFSIDSTADVDVLIIFKENEFQPKTYLNQLRNFGERTYPRSDIFPEHPTIVIELGHTRFELVPSYVNESFWNGKELKIPAAPSQEVKWISTDPLGFQEKLLKKDKEENGLIIPLIRLIKYWNVINGKVFGSYALESFVIGRSYPCKNLKEYFYELIKDLSDKEMAASEKEIFDPLFERRRRLKALEEKNIPEYIEQELISFLPAL